MDMDFRLVLTNIGIFLRYTTAFLVNGRYFCKFAIYDFPYLTVLL